MVSQLRAFLAVVEEGSIHRAAVRLNISQPALSRQMQTLEAELGGPVLERTSTGVKLTPAGIALKNKMGAVLDSYDRVMLDVRRTIQGEVNQLRIGYLPSAARDYLDAPLKILRQRHPKTKIKLLDLTPGEQITALRRAEIDAGLTDSSAQLLEKDFFVRRLASMPSCVALPQDHPLAKSKQIRIAQLRAESFVNGADEEIPGVTQRIASHCRKFGNFRPHFIGRAKSLSETFELIANDNAVCLLPGFMSHHAVRGVVIRPIVDQGATWELFVVWQRGKVSVPLRTLLDALFRPQNS